MTEDARLMHWLSSHRDETATTADPAAHVDIDTLTRHATGRLSPAQAHAVTEHLLVCEDARCVSFVRAQASDVDAASDFLYPPNDERSSSPRTFQCKEMLWKMIGEVASITGAPVDEVINDAMLQYARSRGYHEGPTARRPGDEAELGTTQDAAAFVRRHSDSLRTGAPAPSITTTAVRPGEEDLSESEPSARSRAAAHQSITTQRAPALTPEAVPRAPPSVRIPAGRPMTMPASMPPIPAARPAGVAPPPSRRMPAPPPSAARSLAPPSSRRAPPPLPSTPHMPVAPQSMPLGSMGSMSLSKRLVLTYEGQSFDVDKEHFIIGRSKGQADLRIDDANVSRQHAAIERIGSIYYLVDLGSTNGVYVGDDRVTRRALADGDTIVITNHRIACRLG